MNQNKLLNSKKFDEILPGDSLPQYLNSDKIPKNYGYKCDFGIAKKIGECTLKMLLRENMTEILLVDQSYRGLYYSPSKNNYYCLEYRRTVKLEEDTETFNKKIRITGEEILEGDSFAENNRKVEKLQKWSIDNFISNKLKPATWDGTLCAEKTYFLSKICEEHKEKIITDITRNTQEKINKVIDKNSSYYDKDWSGISL